MSAEYVRSYYDVDYKRGDRVTVDGRKATIVSFPGQYLGVRFDGEKHTHRAHPTWRVQRLHETGEVAEELLFWLACLLTIALIVAVAVLTGGAS